MGESTKALLKKPCQSIVGLLFDVFNQQLAQKLLYVKFLLGQEQFILKV